MLAVILAEYIYLEIYFGGKVIGRRQVGRTFALRV